MYGACLPGLDSFWCCRLLRGESVVSAPRALPCGIGSAKSATTTVLLRSQLPQQAPAQHGDLISGGGRLAGVGWSGSRSSRASCVSSAPRCSTRTPRRPAPAAPCPTCARGWASPATAALPPWRASRRTASSAGVWVRERGGLAEWFPVASRVAGSAVYRRELHQAPFAHVASLFPQLRPAGRRQHARRTPGAAAVAAAQAHRRRALALTLPPAAARREHRCGPHAAHLYPARGGCFTRAAVNPERPGRRQSSKGRALQGLASGQNPLPGASTAACSTRATALTLRVRTDRVHG
jgi:hypothetical protein